MVIGMVFYGACLAVGDRDQGKRRLMGEAAQRLADKIIVTDNNPRHEPSQAIIDDILQGCPTPTQ